MMVEQAFSLPEFCHRLLRAPWAYPGFRRSRLDAAIRSSSFSFVKIYVSPLFTAVRSCLSWILRF
jgi:hypothetical protein